jgi:hypothetical protein
MRKYFVVAGMTRVTMSISHRSPGLPRSEHSPGIYPSFENTNFLAMQLCLLAGTILWSYQYETDESQTNADAKLASPWEYYGSLMVLGLPMIPLTTLNIYDITS